VTVCGVVAEEEEEERGKGKGNEMGLSTTTRKTKGAVRNTTY
jgi:hypothetical protein